MPHALNKHYDVLVVGGGIQGAGVALLASLANYSVLLIDKHQWASATSSKSSKLIHGGLRYLQTGQFTLVRECLREREWMLSTLPALVKSNWFYIPLYKDSSYKSWQINAGLWLYQLLSGRGAHSHYKKIPKAQWPDLSGLNPDGLQAVYAYEDAQTDDAALTQAIVDTATEAGAHCVEFSECVTASFTDGNYSVTLQQADQPRQITCRSIINASGPWVDQVLARLDTGASTLPVDLVQGSHLVISPKISDECFYLEARDDHRAVFCLPWQGRTLVGTTETHHYGDPGSAAPTSAEIDYLTRVVEHYVPKVAFTVENSFAGLRVLPVSDKHPFFRSRDTLVHRQRNIISVYGGKLTAWRSTAVKILTMIDQIFSRESALDIDDIVLVNRQSD